MPKYVTTREGVPVRVTDNGENPLFDPFKVWLKEVADSINVKKLMPDRILKSGNATIVFWNDGGKTIVKRAEDEPDNEYTAFTAALAKRVFGSNNAIKKIIKTKTEVQKLKDDKN